MSTLTQLFTSIANSIRAKKGTSALIEAEDFPTEIETIQTGITPTGTIDITQNGITDVTNYANANVNVEASSGEKDVFFYDYDGTLLYSYTKDAFLALSEMPANPSHTGLVADGWNWTLSDAKTCVTDLGKLNIGQTYHTSSGLSEFDIQLNSQTGLAVTLNMAGNKDWGDGTSDDTTSHTYTTAGKYTITCDGTSISQMYMFGQSSSTVNKYVTNVRLTGVTSIMTYIFAYCQSLETVIISNDLNASSSYQNNMFQQCATLKAFVMPQGPTSIPSNCFYSCYSMAVICLPNSVHSASTSAFQNCRCLSLMTLNSNSFTIGNSAFNGCGALKKITYNHSSSTLGSSAFKECFALEEIELTGSMTINNSASLQFQECRCLKSVKMTNSIKRLSSGMFTNCVALTDVQLPNGVTTMGNEVFFYCCSLKTLDFSEYTAIPTISTSTFNGICPLVKIIVPDDLYTSWKAAQYWSNMADNIVKASQA